MTIYFDLFRYRNTPTLDIYFRRPLHDLIADWRGPRMRRPIRRLGSNSFYCNGTAVIIRYATKTELTTIEALGPDRCLYVIDDDLINIEHHNTLPSDYQARLATFKTELLAPILSIADTIVAPNQLILATYPGKKHHLLPPSYTALCKDFSHFDRDRYDQRVELVFTGTRSHLSDLEFIVDPILDLCTYHPQIRLTTFLGPHAPAPLRGHQNIIHQSPRSWRAFIKILQKRRFHIALAPYRDTLFNRARSINKILDHGAFGAAGIYSRLPPLSQVITQDQNGLLVNEHPADWHRSVSRLINARAHTRNLAQAGADLSKTLGNHENIRQFWLQQFGLN